MTPNHLSPVEVEDGKFLITPGGTIYKKDHQNNWAQCHKVLWQQKDSVSGYQAHIVSITTDGTQQHFYAHRLYAQAFIHNPDPINNIYVTALDGDKTNLTLSNIIWTNDDAQLSHRKAAHKSWYDSVAIPCHRCGRPYHSYKGFDYCSECQIKNKNDDTIAKRHEDIIAQLINIDLDLLKPLHRKYIEMRLNGTTLKEIGDHYGVSKQAVDSTIKRAVMKHTNTEYRIYAKKGTANP